jgi:hypothetical protein
MAKYPCANHAAIISRANSCKWYCNGVSTNGGEEYQRWQPRKPTGPVEDPPTTTCPNRKRSKWSQVSACEKI